MYIYILIVLCLFGKGIHYHYCYYYSCWQTTRWFLLLNLSMYCTSIYLLNYHKINHSWIGKYIHICHYISFVPWIRHKFLFCNAVLLQSVGFSEPPNEWDPLPYPYWTPYHSQSRIPQQLWVFVWEACLWKGVTSPWKLPGSHRWTVRSVWCSASSRASSVNPQAAKFRGWIWRSERIPTVGRKSGRHVGLGWGILGWHG